MRAIHQSLRAFQSLQLLQVLHHSLPKSATCTLSRRATPSRTATLLENSRTVNSSHTIKNSSTVKSNYTVKNIHTVKNSHTVKGSHKIRVSQVNDISAFRLQSKPFFNAANRFARKSSTRHNTNTNLPFFLGDYHALTVQLTRQGLKDVEKPRRQIMYLDLL